MNCPLCQSTMTQKMDEQFYLCGLCFGLVKDKKYYLPPEEERARYEKHNNDVNDAGYQNFASPVTDYVLENFTTKHRGLDFGSGTNSVISKILQDKHYNIAQYDPFFKDDVEALSGSYDYIVCCEVLEHFHHPKAELERLSGLLCAGGKLLIMTLLYHEGLDFKTWFYRRDPTHVFIYQKKTIEYIAKKMGFGIEVLEDRFIVIK